MSHIELKGGFMKFYRTLGVTSGLLLLTLGGYGIYIERHESLAQQTELDMFTLSIVLM